MDTDQLAGQHEASDRVVLYALADPSAFTREAGFITEQVAQALHLLPNANRRIELSIEDAGLTYVNDGELWARVMPPSLPDKAAAVKIANESLAKLSNLCSGENPRWPRHLRGMSWLPSQACIHPESIVAVPHSREKWIDHWHYRFTLRLVSSLGIRQYVPIYGALIEMRIGHQGQIISLRIRWRPLSGEIKEVERSAFVSETAHQSTHSLSLMQYVLEGEGVPQFYLAPYYVSYHGHHLEFASGSPFSLLLDIQQLNSEDEGVRVTGQAHGGSGRYEYNWASYQLQDIHRGLTEHGPGISLQTRTLTGASLGSQLELGMHACVVLLNVRDLDTGAFKHAQHMIFPVPSTQ